MVRGSFALIIVAMVCACGQESSAPAGEGEAPVAANGSATGEEISEDQPGPPANAADALPGPAEPAADAGSAAAAVETFERYARLLSGRRFAEARLLWSDGGRSSGMDEATFAGRLGRYAKLTATSGEPGRIEGAAGSLFIEIPVRFHAVRDDGSALLSSGTATLRRVNDVPGSTAEQRQWRIYRLELQPAL